MSSFAVAEKCPGGMASQGNYLVTGAGRGIGRGLSQLLLKRGNRVFLIDHNSEELSNTAALLGKHYKSGKDFEALVCNLRDSAEIRSAAEKANRLFSGHLDCLVNNAACKNSIVTLVETY